MNEFSTWPDADGPPVVARLVRIICAKHGTLLADITDITDGATARTSMRRLTHNEAVHAALRERNHHSTPEQNKYEDLDGAPMLLELWCPTHARNGRVYRSKLVAEAAAARSSARIVTVRAKFGDE